MEIATHMLRTGRRGLPFEFRMALRDLRASLKRLDLTLALARHDLLSRYRGSIRGPFWITLSMAIMVAGISAVYARLFHLSLHDYVPYVAIGIVLFGFISGMMNEGCDTFVHAAGMLSQTSLPMFTFVWRTVARNFLNLAHHLVIVIAVLVAPLPPLGESYWRVANVPLALVGFVLVALNASWASLLAGVASARFRDIPQVISSVTQFAMLMTPVFWFAGQFPSRHAVLMFNPFFHLLSAVRDPLMGKPVEPETWLVLVVMAVGGWVAAFSVFALTRRRIVHYL